MPSLDTRGIISAAQLGVYVLICVSCVLLLSRFAFTRDGGWFFLFFFGIVRVTGGALILAAELVATPIVDLYIVAYLLYHVGLALLLAATIGFLGQAGKSTYSHEPRIQKWLRGVAILLAVPLALSVAGGLLGTHVSPDTENTGMILRQVAAGIYAAIFVLLCLLHFVCLSHRVFMRTHRRRMLGGMFLALPFLGARCAYEVLTAWSSTDPFGNKLSTNPALAQFNPVQGNYLTYLLMGLVSEFLTAIIYLLFSTVLSEFRRR